jgi:hypothetical protein
MKTDNCPDQPFGSYIGSALILEDACTLHAGDVAPYDAMIDDEILPYSNEELKCSSIFINQIDKWRYDGELTLLTDNVWIFDGYVKGKHCTLRLLITAFKETGVTSRTLTTFNTLMLKM